MAYGLVIVGSIENIKFLSREFIDFTVLTTTFTTAKIDNLGLELKIINFSMIHTEADLDPEAFHLVLKLSKITPNLLLLLFTTTF